VEYSKTFIFLLTLVFQVFSLHSQGVSVSDFPEEYFTRTPIFEKPPEIDPANELLQLGYLDVTLYGAIPDDGADDTDPIMQFISHLGPIM
jgi:hypothetical protein